MVNICFIYPSIRSVNAQQIYSINKQGANASGNFSVPVPKQMEMPLWCLATLPGPLAPAGHIRIVCGMAGSSKRPDSYSQALIHFFIRRESYIELNTGVKSLVHDAFLLSDTRLRALFLPHLFH